MDAMKDALKSKMMSMKKGPGMPSDEETPGVKDGEMAPPVDDAGPAVDGDMMADTNAGAVDPGLIQAAAAAAGPDVLTQILMAIADSSSGSGGNPNTLGGRAAAGAQSKLDSMKK